MKRYFLPYRERRRLHDRAYRAQQCDHSEVCGVMVVDQHDNIELWFLKNHCKRPYHYEIDGQKIQIIKKKVSADKKRILGSFHSHPIGESNPSIQDQKKSFFAGVEMIYDVCAREVKLWKKIKKGVKFIFKELPLILDPQKKK